MPSLTYLQLQKKKNVAMVEETIGMDEADAVVMTDEPEEVVDEGPTVMVSKITVTGVESINFEKVLGIVLDYEGRELSLHQMYAIAEEITDLYATKGYVTSHAYVPEQDVSNGEIENSCC